MQITRIGASRLSPSSTTISGRSRATPSKNRRTAHPISSAVADRPTPPLTTAATRDATSSADGSEGISAVSAAARSTSSTLPPPSASRTTSINGQYVMPSP
jgi:hypothetical protein